MTGMRWLQLSLGGMDGWKNIDGVIDEDRTCFREDCACEDVLDGSGRLRTQNIRSQTNVCICMYI